MDVAIVSADTDDVDAVLDQWVSLVEGQREYGSHIEGAPNRGAARKLLAEYAQAEMLAVARPEGEPEGPIWGFVMYYQEEGLYEQSVTRGVIENVYVAPAVRDEGVGSALLTYAESELAESGVEVVGITAMADNEDAIDWYRDRGYEPQRLVLERDLDDERKR